MAFHGEGTFENDDALMLLRELLESSDTLVLKDAFETVEEEYDEDEYVELSECCAAIAAAEVVAALRGKPAASLPKIVRLWVKGKPPASPGLVKRARRAIEAVVKDSEMMEFLEDGQLPSEWKTRLNDLLVRLD